MRFLQHCEDDGEIWTDNQGITFYITGMNDNIPIKYCPFCGKKL